MDGREGMALSGSPSYYLHRGISGGSSGSAGGATHTAFNPPPGYRNLPNPNNVHHQIQSNFRGSAFNVDGSPSTFPPHGFSMTMAPSSAATAAAAGGSGGDGPLSGSGPVKKKRGRPRKYVPDGSGVGTRTVSLGLSPLSSPNSITPSERRKRGRPPGSGRKQRLASVGEWMSNSAGLAFTPHVIYVSPGEDIASKILSFAQQRPRALCIMSASGSVSAVTLHQPASSVGNVTYEGRFEILCLSGSYLIAETGGARNRTGGINVSLSNHDGQVIGGSVAGRLIASRSVQVVVCSFVHGCQRPVSPATPKTKTESESKGEKKSHSEEQNGGGGQVSAFPSQQMNTPNSGWPVSKAMDGRNPNTDIDLMRG
ncbi:hypothetical protein V2J09_020237 [Rumex salicifolius]